MAASRSSCANGRRMFNPDSRASMTSLAPVACTVREVASRCSASSRNVILHDGISPFGVAIAPEYCTDAIFILTEGDFFGDAAGGGASFPICCGTLPTRSPSSCFVMYDPQLPLFSPTITQHARRHLLRARGGFAANCRMKIRTSRGEPHHSLTVAARGRVGRTRAAVGQLPSENGQTHAQSNSRNNKQRKLNSLIYREDLSRPRQPTPPALARARGVSVDLHRPLKEAHNTCVCRGTTLRFGHN